MELPEKMITDFQNAFFQDFGEKISEEDAASMAQNLLNLFGAVYFPESDPKKPP